MMGRPQTIFPNQKYGRLTVIERSKTNTRYFKCRCKCGNEKEVFTSHLLQGRTTSCGCYHKEVISKLMKQVNRTHGMYGTSTYNAWAAMLDRCRNPKSRQWKDYGGRGIKVCDEWKTFEKFYTDMGDKRGLTLERIDNELGYSKENCKWATCKEQANNRRACVVLEFQGMKKNITQWSEELGVSRRKIYDRLRRGNWSIEKALTTP